MGNLTEILKEKNSKLENDGKVKDHYKSESTDIWLNIRNVNLAALKEQSSSLDFIALKHWTTGRSVQYKTQACEI